VLDKKDVKHGWDFLCPGCERFLEVT